MLGAAFYYGRLPSFFNGTSGVPLLEDPPLLLDDASLKVAMNGASVFQVNITEFSDYSVYQMPDGAFLRYTTLYKDSSYCYGKTKIQTSDLHAGIAKFPVQINEDKVELVGTWKDDKFIERK